MDRPIEPYLVPPRERRLHAPHGRRSTDVRSHLREGVTGCRIVELPRVTDPRGNLTFIEAGAQVPFSFDRVYYLYDVPGGESRGGHAHRQLEQLVIAASGSFDVIVDDGTHRERFFLNRSYYGLYIPRMVWRELDDFSSGSVCLVRGVGPLRRGRLLPRLRRVRLGRGRRARREGRVSATMSPPTVPFLDLAAANAELREELTAAAAKVIARRARAARPLGRRLRGGLRARYVGADHAVGVGNGLDALHPRPARAGRRDGRRGHRPVAHLHRHLARRHALRAPSRSRSEVGRRPATSTPRRSRRRSRRARPRSSPSTSTARRPSSTR